jgi:hypothetical protein
MNYFISDQKYVDTPFPFWYFVVVPKSGKLSTKTASAKNSESLPQKTENQNGNDNGNTFSD